MADREIENDSQEVPEIPEILEKVLLFSLDEAKEKIKDNLFIESHPGETAEECFNFAEHTVKGARGADAYALCYDGYIDTDDGQKDALIAEGGVPGEDEGFAVGFLYAIEGEEPVFEDEPVFIGAAPNFMGSLKDASEYGDDEIDEKYLEDAPEDEPEPEAL